MNKLMIINSCPFLHCNSSDLIVDSDPFIDGAPPGNFWVMCNKCQALGPMGGTREEAIKLWNKTTSTIER